MTPMEIKPKNFFKSLFQPVDSSSLIAFRVLFGLLMCGSMIRFLANGWVESLYLTPKFFFPFFNLSWIHPWPALGMYLHFILLAILAFFIAIGFCYRVSILLFFLGFGYIELIDKTNYLNHYYFISLLSFLMIFIPLHRSFSVDVWLKPSLKSDTLPRWMLSTFRLQTALVYCFAGFAKLKPDWLFHAQPLRIWLGTYPEFPIIGAYFDQPWVAYAMSWMGVFFDLTVPFWLLWSRSRIWAYLVVVVFHLMTFKLFRIGMFPWIMMFTALIFFPPDWPKRLLAKLNSKIRGYLKSPLTPTLSPPGGEGGRISSTQKLGIGLLGFYFLLQFLIPLRHFLYSGNVCWTEEGFRFSWNVMLIEKNGMAKFNVYDPESGKRWWVSPREYLVPQQVKMMSSQPDMILDFAHHLSKIFEQKGYPNVEVYADAYASLNGRSAQRLIDPNVNLAKEKYGWKQASWIIPFQESPVP